MEALYLLVPFSVVVVFFSIWLFLNMSDSGQFDDMVGPALRVVQDDDLPDGSGREAGTTVQVMKGG
jgi:cbb3-type cytochrome oxidase maturation protein